MSLRHPSHRLLGLSALCASAALGATALTSTARAASTAPSYRTEMLHFEVRIGPGGSQVCDVLGELYTPAAASSSSRVPVILTTNGFGGSYSDQAGLAAYGASHGYAVLTYSGLGFGGSGCKVTLDDPTSDGEAASQLISFLGGEDGIAFSDAAHTQPVAGLDYVIHDSVDHAGHADTFDPRVGMVGGSYGGEIQFATADVDPRLDTIVPLITWNSLNYSLAPNNAGLAQNGPVVSQTPGAAKSTWALLFSGDGIADGVQYAQTDPRRDVGCPNFATWVCPGLVHAAALGYPDATTAADLAHASVSNYMSDIRVPTLLIQGENDTLFNLNEAVANFRALRAQGIPVSMIWQSWGHSGSTPAPGELDLASPDPSTQYETGRIMGWFDHYLKGVPGSTGPAFSYFQDWVPYTGIATPAYATASSYPVGRDQSYYLSGAGDLVGSSRQLTVGSQAFVTSPGGLPAGTAEPDAAAGEAPAGTPTLPETAVPATYATWQTQPLSAPVTTVGEPVLHVQLVAPAAAQTEAAGPAGDLVVFAKLYDVAPDGSASLIHGLVAPARIADATRPVTITLPGIVHRFAPGHRIRLVLSGGDINYRGGLVSSPVLVTTGNTGQVLELPVVPGSPG